MTDQLLIDHYVKTSSDSTPLFYVDMGAADGITQSNSYQLMTSGWSGIAIECDMSKVPSLQHHCKGKAVKVLTERIFPDNVVSVLRSANCPPTFKVLSVDIDGYDFFVVDETLKVFQPTVIIAEINEKIPPPIKFTVLPAPSYRWGVNHFFGCSISKYVELCDTYAYDLVCLHYNNAIFVRRGAHNHSALSAQQAYAAGYQNQPDRSSKFPWNNNVDKWLTMPTELVVKDIQLFFANYTGQYSIEVEGI